MRDSDEQFIFDESRPSTKSLSLPNAGRKKDRERDDTIRVERIHLLMGKQGDQTTSRPISNCSLNLTTRETVFLLGGGCDK